MFVPLCGKTLDIGWLLSKGYKVVGAELSETAIDQLFSELGVEPTKKNVDGFVHYKERDIDIFVGDIFQLTANLLGPVDAVYDRAALVALPDEMRNRYTSHVPEITGDAPQLLLTFEYDQSVMKGPPFSVSDEEVLRQYKDQYELTRIGTSDVDGGLKGVCPAEEHVWLLLRGNEK